MTTTPEPPLTAEEITANRRVLHDGAFTAAQKIKRFIEESTIEYDEQGNAVTPITPETMNAYQKAVSIVLILAPLPGEKGYASRGPTLPDPRKLPESLDEITSDDLRILRMHDHSGETSRKRKKTKAG